MTVTEPEHSLFSIAADLKIAIGEFRQSVKEDQYWRKMAKKSAQPIFYTYTDVATAATGQLTVIRLTGPDQGHFWLGRVLTITDVTQGLLGGAIVGTTMLAVSGADCRSRTALNQFSGFEVIDILNEDPIGTLSNPLIQRYSGEQVVARFNEEFYAIINGGTNGHQYAATLRVMDFEEAAFKQEWAI